MQTGLLLCIQEKSWRRELVKKYFLDIDTPYTWALLNAAPSLELERKQQLFSIEGTPPDLIHPPKGCPFAERCKYCMSICTEVEPPEYEFEDGHKACCWLYHPQSEYREIDFSKEEL